MEREWADVLHEIIDDPKIKTSIEEKGFHQFPEWKEFRKKYKINNDNKFAKPPRYVSINFWSEQEDVLTKNNLYILRTGGGKFAIIDEEKF